MDIETFSSANINSVCYLGKDCWKGAREWHGSFQIQAIFQGNISRLLKGTLRKYSLNMFWLLVALVLQITYGMTMAVYFF